MPFNATKDPQAKLDYSIDWTAWLAGDTIASSSWTADAQSGLVLYNQAVTDSKVTTTWMRGGALRSVPYAVTNHIITGTGREDDRTILVTIAQK